MTDMQKVAETFLAALGKIEGSDPAIVGVGFTWNLRGGVQATPDEHVTILPDGRVIAEFDGDVFHHDSIEAYTDSVRTQLTMEDDDA